MRVDKGNARVTSKHQFSDAENVQRKTFLLGTAFGLFLGAGVAIGMLLANMSLKKADSVKITEEQILASQFMKSAEACLGVDRQKIDSVELRVYRDNVSPSVVILRCEKEGFFNGASSVSGLKFR